MSNRFRAAAIAAAALSSVIASCGPKSSEPSPASTPPTPTAATATSAAAKPATIGACVETTVTLVGPRLEGAPNSGSGIVYANGMSQVEYDAIPGIDHSRVGDAVRLCLVSIPKNCPPGDDRGRVYAGTNLRTNETWSVPDSEHMCGGA